MKLVIITGQTATGKTDYAVQLAKKYDGELINCDSRQIYKGLDIITGKVEKPSRFETLVEDRNSKVKVWLYDIVDPRKYFSSFDYVTYALKVIQDILSRKKTPIIVGGTYFYLYHLLYDIETQFIEPDWKLRNEYNKKSVVELQKIFQSLNVQSFNRLNNSDKNNPQRLIRKIEILTHNKPRTLFVRGKNSDIDSFQIPKLYSLSKKIGKSVQIEYIGLCYKDARVLKKIIKKRVENRIENGAIKEVRMLLKHGYSEFDPGLKTIGYSQIITYIKGQITLKEAIEQWITKEIQYAKRQYTFMKKDPHIFWKEFN